MTSLISTNSTNSTNPVFKYEYERILHKEQIRRAHFSLIENKRIVGSFTAYPPKTNVDPATEK